ncbi:MAG: AAA family ATPase [Actinomycetota bacterium]|nr:AAA family ATPase [Actinomycetota bacterium]
MVRESGFTSCVEPVRKVLEFLGKQVSVAILDTRDVVPLLPTPNTGRAEDPGGLVDAGGDRAVELAGEETNGRPMRSRDGTLLSGIRHERRYSTTELLATEQRILDVAVTEIGAGRWTAPHRLIEARLRRHRHLTEGQREMIRRFATSGNAIDIGMGPAGSGKTAVMAVISQLATLTGTPILGGRWPAGPPPA